MPWHNRSAGNTARAIVFVVLLAAALLAGIGQAVWYWLRAFLAHACGA